MFAFILKLWGLMTIVLMKMNYQQMDWLEIWVKLILNYSLLSTCILIFITSVVNRPFYSSIFILKFLSYVIADENDMNRCLNLLFVFMFIDMYLSKSKRHKNKIKQIIIIILQFGIMLVFYPVGRLKKLIFILYSICLIAMLFFNKNK